MTNEFVRHVGLKFAPRPDVHLLQVGLAEACLAQHLAEAGKTKAMRVEPTGQDGKALPRRLHILDGIGEIGVGQRPAMFIRAGFASFFRKPAREARVKDRLSSAAATVFKSMNEPRRTGLWIFFFRSPFVSRCFRRAANWINAARAVRCLT